MKETGQKKISMAMAVIFGILFLFVLVKNMNLAAESKHLRAENLQLTGQVSRLEIDIKGNKEQAEAERNLYTVLAAKLHQTTKRVAELEAQLKK